MARLNILRLRKGVYFLAVPILVLYTLTLTGSVSSSPGIPNIFVGELELNQTQSGTLTSANSSMPVTRVRFGYFGICTTSNKTFSCAPSMGTSTDALTSTLSISSPLVSYVLRLQHTISYTIPSSASIIFLIGLITLMILQSTISSQMKVPTQSKAKRIKHLTLITRFMLWISTTLNLIAAYCVTSTLAALQVAMSSPTGNFAGESITRGKTMEVLEWMTLGFSALFSLFVDIMLRAPAPDGGLEAGKGTMRTSPFQPVILGG